MISTDKAREILGKKAERLTDNQIGIIISSLYRLAETVVDHVTRMTPAEREARFEKTPKGK